MIFRIVFVQMKITFVVGYVRVWFDRGYVPGRSGFIVAGVVESVQFVRGVVDGTIRHVRAKLLTQSLIQCSFTLESTLELCYPRVDRCHFGLPLRQSQSLLGYHLILLFVHLVAILAIRTEEKANYLFEQT